MGPASSSAPPAKIWLFLTLLLYVAFWFIYPQEFIASDPGAYSARAFAISQDFNFGHGDVFDQRMGINVPVAFIYSVFGVNIFTTNLWPLFAALLVVVTVWMALPEDKSKIIGALLCLTSIPLFQSSIALYPDIVAASLMASSSLILFNRQRFIGPQKIGYLAPVAAVSLLFAAFLAKESAYWILPLWAWAFSSDLRSINRTALIRRFYLPAFALGILLGLIYLFFCDVTWGDPLSRFHSIQALTGQHLWSWGKAPAGELTKRLTTAPLGLFFEQYGPIPLLLATLGAVIAPQSLKPWRYYAACCLFFFWFGSTSFTLYEPMPLIDRMTLPLLPALYILAAYTISRFSITLDRPRLDSINSFLPILLVLSFAGFPFSQYVESWRGVQLPEATAMAVIKNDIKRHPDKQYLLVCSDIRSPQSLSFYFSYKYPQNLRVIFAGDLTDELANRSERYIYADKRRSAFLKSAYGQRHYDNEIDSLGIVPLYQFDSVELFRGVPLAAIGKLMTLDDHLSHKN